METERDYTLDVDLDLVRQPSEATVAFVPPVSIEDHPLLWMVVRSQTYYPEHILTYGSGKTRHSLVKGLGPHPNMDSKLPHPSLGLGAVLGPPPKSHP